MDAAALVGHLVPAGSVFAFLGEHRREVFPVSLFEDLLPSEGAAESAGRGRGVGAGVADTSVPSRGGIS
jgi:hypothetical protein